jgi:hypothetical protein
MELRGACCALALAALGCAAPAPDYAGEEVVCEWVMSPQYVGFGGSLRIRPERRCRAVPLRSAEPPSPPGDLRPAPGPAPKIEVESEERK